MNNQLCERMRTHYPPGTRVQLLRMDDPYAPVPSGTRGTVTHVDDMGQLQMRWDKEITAEKDEYSGTVKGNSGDSCRQNQYPVGHYEILGYGVPSY